MQALVDHWPFAAATLILATFGQVVKRGLWNDEAAKHCPVAAFGRATLPIQPVIVGGFLGLLRFPASAGVADTRGSVLYFAFAGVVSTWAYSVARALFKARGMVVELPGDSVLPPVRGGEHVDEALQVTSQDDIDTLNETGKGKG